MDLLSWILDIDEHIDEARKTIIKKALKDIPPEGDKFITEIPSKNGIHMIVKPFNLQKAQHILGAFEIDVHKNNPTNLYIP